MIAQRTLDVGLILDVVAEPRMFDAISEDGATVETLKFDVINEYWVELNVDGVTIGVANFRPMFIHTFDCHIHIVHEHREHSMKAGGALLNWCKENIPNSVLYTNVPVFCESVKKFLLAFDFEESGYIKNAWLKNGKQNDMWILTRGILCQ